MSILGDLRHYLPLTPLDQAISAKEYRLMHLLTMGGAGEKQNLSSHLVDAAASSVNPEFIRRLLRHNTRGGRILDAILGGRSFWQTTSGFESSISSETALESAHNSGAPLSPVF